MNETNGKDDGVTTANEQTVRPGDEIIIQTAGLTKEYEEGRIKALRGVDITVRRGEFVAVMGPSGSGKSTLLHMIGALDLPTEGEVIIDGTSLSRTRNLSKLRAEKIGFVFQAFNLIPSLSALENVEIPMYETRLSGSERRRRAAELLEAVGLAERARQRPPQLSGGERQRVAIARSLANDPAIILGDEPTGNLDSKTSEAVIQLMREIHEEHRHTFVIVTHDPQIASYADRIIHLLDGRVTESPDETPA